MLYFECVIKKVHFHYTYNTHLISRFANLYQSLNIFNNFDGCYLILEPKIMPKNI